MKVLKNFAAACVLAVLSNMAVALPIEYRFDVDYTTGYLAGISVPVFVTLEGVSGTGAEVFRERLGNLLGFRHKIGGVTLDLWDVRENRFPPPTIRLRNGNLVAVEGSFEFFSFSTTFAFNSQGNYVGSWDRYFDGSTGQVNVASWTGPATAVPAPATHALLALGLAGLGVYRRKRTPNR
jgi:hypothetical protein